MTRQTNAAKCKAVQEDTNVLWPLKNKQNQLEITGLHKKQVNVKEVCLKSTISVLQVNKKRLK